MSDEQDSESHRPFVFWRPFSAQGGLAVLTPYHTKYRGGVSPRDAMALATALGAIARSSPDASFGARVTERIQENDLKRNLVLIGSGSANPIVRKFMRELRSSGKPLSFSLGQGYWVDFARERAGLPKNLVSRSRAEALDLGAQHSVVDFGILARAPNPYNPSSTITFIAGIHGYGTLAAAELFANAAHQEEIEKNLDSSEVAFDRDVSGPDGNALIEVILKTAVSRDEEELDQPVRRLTAIDVQLVRIDGRLERQSPAAPDEDIWTIFQPEPRHPSNPHRFSIFFDDVDEGTQRAFVALRGQYTRTHFRDLRFSEDDCSKYNAMMNEAIAAKDSAIRKIKRIGRALANDLAPAMASAPGIARPMRDDELTYVFGGPARFLRIPFEITRTENNDYLGLSHPVVRSLNDLVCTRRSLNADVLEDLRQRQERLEILLVVSDPLGDLAAAADEATEIQKCLNCFQSPMKITILSGRDATIKAFKNQIKTGSFHILHFIGHSLWEAEKLSHSCLLLQDENGAPAPLYLDELGHILKDKNSRLSFCYLSSCQGTAAGDRYQEAQYDFLGIADSLVRAGIPAVLGFRAKVRDTVARAFAQHFYGNLWQPRRAFSLARALLYARREVNDQWKDDPACFMPILVMQN